MTHTKGRIASIVAVLSLLVTVVNFWSLLNPDIFGTWIANRLLLYILYAVMLAVGLLTSRSYTTCVPLIVFSILAAISTMLNDIPERFNPWMRLAAFAVFLCLMSPVLQSESFRFIHKYLLKWTLVFMRISVVASVLIYPFWVKTIFENCYAFPGVLCHGMLLSMVASLTLADAVWRLFNRRLGLASRIGYALLIVACLLCMVAGASRCAMLALVFGIAVIFATSHWTRRRVVAVSTSCLLAAGFIFALPSFTFDALNKKINVAQRKGSITVSRDELWEARCLEICESPVIGIGFANSTHFSRKFDEFDPELGGYKSSEPGSSWLSVLSNTGILGALAMLWFNILVIVRIIRGLKSHKAMMGLYATFYVMMAVNATFEGWLLYGGALYFLIFWLTTSRIFEITDYNENFSHNSDI